MFEFVSGNDPAQGKEEETNGQMQSVSWSEVSERCTESLVVVNDSAVGVRGSGRGGGSGSGSGSGSVEVVDSARIAAYVVVVMRVRPICGGSGLSHSGKSRLSIQIHRLSRLSRLSWLSWLSYK